MNDAKINHAVGYMEQGQFHKSQLLLSEVLQQDPKDSIAIMNTLICFSQMKEYDKVIDFYETHKDILANTVFKKRALMLTIWTLVQKKEFLEAKNRTLDALLSENEDEHLLNTAGFIFEKLKDNVTALDYYQKCLSYYPEQKTALNSAAYLIADMDGDLDLAAKMIAAVLQQESQNPVYLDTAAWIAHKKGNITLAKKYLSLAIQKMDTLPIEEQAILLNHQKIIESLV